MDWVRYPELLLSQHKSIKSRTTVDGRNPANQLRLVVFPIIYKVLYIPGGAGFLPSTVSRGCRLLFVTPPCCQGRGVFFRYGAPWIAFRAAAGLPEEIWEHGRFVISEGLALWLKQPCDVPLTYPPWKLTVKMPENRGQTPKRKQRIFIQTTIFPVGFCCKFWGVNMSKWQTGLSKDYLNIWRIVPFSKWL